MRLLAFILILLFATENLFSQHMGYYIDAKDRLMVYDDGEKKQIEYKPPRSIKVGDFIIAYVDHTGEFKIYFPHKKHLQ